LIRLPYNLPNKSAVKEFQPGAVPMAGLRKQRPFADGLGTGQIDAERKSAFAPATGQFW
jgi:hypothetical protein